MSGENYNIKLKDDGASGGNYNVKVKDGASSQPQTAQRRRSCDVCKTTIILDTNRFCTDCRMYLCDRCILPHSKFPLTASHPLSDPGSREGKIRFQLQNVGQVGPDREYYSEETKISKIPWCLGVGRWYGDLLRVRLFCDRHGTLDRSEFSVDVEFSVSLMHPDAGKTLTKKHAWTFSSNDRIRWFGETYVTCLCLWKDLVSDGFIIDNSITFEADVRVKSVRGVPA